MKVLLVIVACVLLFAMIGSCMGDTGSSNASTAKCKSCGRTFKAGDAAGNYRSIARTNMCKNCYSNYQWAQNALGN